MKLIFLGPPGAGKGTQAALISEKLGIPAISTGDMLRSAVKAGTEVGKKAKALIDAGKLVPDDVIIPIVAERVAQPDCSRGYILDGVPRTLAQAQALEKADIHFDHVISIEVPDDEVTHRIMGRRVCLDCGATYHVVVQPPVKEGICDRCGSELVHRKDDTEETIRGRLTVYHRETEPLKEFYAKRGLLRLVENTGSIESVDRAILAILGV